MHVFVLEYFKSEEEENHMREIQKRWLIKFMVIEVEIWARLAWRGRGFLQLRTEIITEPLQAT